MFSRTRGAADKWVGGRMSVFLALGCVVAMTGSSGRAQALLDVPDALCRAVDARSADVLTTAEIEWMQTSYESDRLDTKPVTRFLSSVAAQDRYLTIDRGDEAGVVMRRVGGEPSRHTYTGPTHALMWDGEIWMHRERSPHLEVWDGREAQLMFSLFDLRQLGFDPSRLSRSLEQVLAIDPQVRIEFSSEMELGLHVVTARFIHTDSDGSFQWWIDPQKQWNIVRNRVSFWGEVAGETVFTLENFDGVWFPRRIERYEPTYREPTRIIEVLHASFNQPAHRRTLTPADIGAEVGMNIQPHTPEKRGPLTIWHGQKAENFERYLARVASGELKPGVALHRERARLRTLNARDGITPRVQCEVPASPAESPTSQKTHP